MSPDGRSVYFETRLAMTADDNDGGLDDIYVSRLPQPGCKSAGKQPKKCGP
jgi:hypothetical protein